MNLVGSWKIIRMEAIRSNGDTSIAWLGANPAGMIVYDPNGFMCVQIMRRPRDDSQKDVYYAYFGTYEVDAHAATIIHRIEGSLFPDEIGNEYRQSFSLLENTLELVTEEHVFNGEERRNRLVLQRLKH